MTHETLKEKKRNDGYNDIITRNKGGKGEKRRKKGAKREKRQILFQGKEVYCKETSLQHMITQSKCRKGFEEDRFHRN